MQSTRKPQNIVDRRTFDATLSIKQSVILKCLLTATLSSAALVLCLVLSEFTGAALFSLLVFHLSLRPRIREVLATLMPAFLFWASYGYFFRVPLSLKPSPIFVLESLSAGSLVILSGRAVWSTAQERKRVLSVLFPALGLLVFLVAKQKMVNFGALQGATYDLYLFLVDGSLGFYFFEILRHFFGTSAIGGRFIVAVYGLLPVAMAIVYTAHLRKHNSRYYMLQLLLVAGLLGWAFYNLLPAAGPAYFLGPDISRALPAYDQLRQLRLERIAIPPHVFRNAMPSLHMSWGLLLAWNARGLSRPVRWFAIIFAVLTAIATLGTGEHYLIDLVVAFPFSLLVQSLCTRRLPDSSPRLQGLCAGAFMTFAWMLVIRENPTIFLENRFLPWSCIILTLGLSEVVFHNLENAAGSIFWESEKEARQNAELEELRGLVRPS